MAGVGGIPDHRPVGVLELQGAEHVVVILDASVLQELSQDVVKLRLRHSVNQVGQVGCTASVSKRLSKVERMVIFKPSF